MKDVYITDHVKKAEKFLTFSEEEDEHFFKYSQALNNYKVSDFVKPKPTKGKYERGSLAQRIFDPLAGARRNENGTLVYEVVDKEVLNRYSEEELRGQFERAINQTPLEGSPEEMEALRIALLEEIQANNLPLDQWNEMLDKELSIFKSDEKYDYVKDIQDAYAEGLKTPLAIKILDTIPDHYFWDIKTPINREEDIPLNPYNPARKVPGENFFDLRQNEEWMKERREKRLLKPTTTMHRNY